MNILIIHSHNANRGDEAAVKAMVDELLLKYPEAEITISNNGFTPYPKMDKRVKQISRFPKLQSKIAQLEFFFLLFTKGHFAFTKEAKTFFNVLREADLVIHAPGGPSIGDIYYKAEKLYLWRLNLIRRMGIPYMFYAPSMGPFKNKERSALREEVLRGAEKIILRDPISIGYLNDFLPDLKAEHAFDSALQHDVDMAVNSLIYNKYSDLKNFIESHEKCIGITITDLKWHPVHKNDSSAEKITEAFHKFIEQKVGEGYGVVFIPQLYGTGNDTELMNKFMIKGHTFMVDAFEEDHDAYFQQYVVGKLYAVVGMRYHSNIFSAKMGTPFISVAYEQKMSGFMKSIGLSEYCLDLSELSYDRLNNRFNALIADYDNYKNKLSDLHEYMKKGSHKSTEVVIEILEGK
ncbi:MAG: polysaccharide pyruvyl transferase family protein [Clostridiales bacterium]|nr:polysaccharide pyruvyl transferase family protein [Clostridiales bacterium]